MHLYLIVHKSSRKDNLAYKENCLQGQLKSEAALLLEVFSRIFHKVEAKELLFAKQLQSNNITGSRYDLPPRSRRSL